MPNLRKINMKISNTFLMKLFSILHAWVIGDNLCNIKRGSQPYFFLYFRTNFRILRAGICVREGYFVNKRTIPSIFGNIPFKKSRAGVTVSFTRLFSRLRFYLSNNPRASQRIRYVQTVQKNAVCTELYRIELNSGIPFVLLTM